MSTSDTLPTPTPDAPTLGTPSAWGGDGGVAPESASDSESLSDHEATFSPDAQRQPQADPDDDTPDTERDERGQFKPRHRATSQRAGADDVPAISEHTRRIKDAEAKLGADILRKDGESERVYNLRRRAELLDRLAAPPVAVAPPKPIETPRPSVQPTARREPLPTSFPDSATWFAMEGNDGKSYEDYSDARTEWKYAVLREAERAEEAEASAHRTLAERVERHNSRIPAARAKYPDWDAVVTASVTLTPVISAAILASEHSADIAYYLGTHPDELAALRDDTADDRSPAAVATLRRYLDTLVASQRSPVTPTRTAAAPTGSVPALAPPAPRPPNPVRTGTIAVADTPPDDDDMSLSSHEKHYMPRSRRR